jgi:hypothetical protein
MTDKSIGEKQVWMEESEVPANELVDRIRELARDSNVQRIVVRNIYDEVMVDIPLPVGVFFGGMMMLFAPGLVGLGGIGVLLSHVKVQVIRETEEIPDRQAEMEPIHSSQAYPMEDDQDTQQALGDNMGRTRVRVRPPVTEDQPEKTRVRVARPLDGDSSVRTSVRVSPRRRHDEPEVTRVKTAPSPLPAADDDGVAEPETA